MIKTTIYILGFARGGKGKKKRRGKGGKKMETR